LQCEQNAIKNSVSSLSVSAFICGLSVRKQPTTCIEGRTPYQRAVLWCWSINKGQERYSINLNIIQQDADQGEHASQPLTTTLSMLEHLPVTCWSLIVEKLSIKDFLVVSCSSKAVWSAIKSTQGLWLQACMMHLGWPAAARVPVHLPLEPSARQLQQYSCSIQHSADAGLTPTGAAAVAPYASMAATDDALARQAAAAMAGLAHTVQGLRPRFKAQSYLLPPWLAMQPGKARGFTKIFEPGSTALNPSLVLDVAQVQWLSLGCLSGENLPKLIRFRL